MRPIASLPLIPTVPSEPLLLATGHAAVVRLDQRGRAGAAGDEGLRTQVLLRVAAPLARRRNGMP